MILVFVLEWREVMAVGEEGELPPPDDMDGGLATDPPPVGPPPAVEKANPSEVVWEEDGLDAVPYGMPAPCKLDDGGAGGVGEGYVSDAALAIILLRL